MDYTKTFRIGSDGLYSGAVRLAEVDAILFAIACESPNGVFHDLCAVSSKEAASPKRSHRVPMETGEIRHLFLTHFFKNTGKFGISANDLISHMKFHEDEKLL